MLKQNIIIEFTNFLQTLNTHRTNAKVLTTNSLVRTSLHLLEELPAVRDIIFEYFSLIAEVAVKSYVINANMKQQPGDIPIQHQKPNHNQVNSNTAKDEDSCFQMIQQVLENNINKLPAAWGVVIASWSLDLVGSLSDKYTQRKMPIGIACNYWLNCSAMRGLLTLINIVFRKLSNVEAESCVETLLSTYQRYSNTYDWVVARLGGCFPSKVVSQILQCSLKRFAEDYRCRIDSEIGILEYLCFAHEQVVKLVLKELFQDGFYPKKNLDAIIIPFLLLLANYSDILLQNIVSVFLDMYNEELRMNIILKSPLWINNPPFAEMQPSLNNIILRLQRQGTQLLLLASQLADQYSWCQDFLEYTLQELEQVILNARLCPLMDDLVTEESKYLLWNSCLSKNIYEQQTAVRLLLIISTQHSHIYYQTISELLRKCYSKNTDGLGAIIRMIGGFYGVVEFPHIKPGIQMVFEEVLLQEQFNRTSSGSDSVNSEALNTFENLTILTKLQKKNNFSYIKQHELITVLNACVSKILQILEVTLSKLILNMDEEAAEINLNKFQELQNQDISNTLPTYENQCKRIKLCSDHENAVDQQQHQHEVETCKAKRIALANAIIELLNAIDAGDKNWIMRTYEVLKLSVLSVKYFFISLTQKDINQRTPSVNRAYKLFQRLCRARKASRTACLRELLEGALFYYGYIFGQYEEPLIDELQIPASEMVLLQNQCQNQGSNANRTVLHAGVIGRGLRPESYLVEKGCPSDMQTLFVKGLDACCSDLDRQISIEAYSTISLLLVEMVSSDVMYNGLPFPDEDFIKVTMERDLLIRRSFEHSPLLWVLLAFVATHRSALCYASVLLRGLTATCLHQWRAKNVNKYQLLNPKDELMRCTRKLLQILAMGQLLPPPLSNLHAIIQHFDPPEIALLLKECVWNYLKDHIPSPALFHVDNNGLQWRNSQLNKIPPQYVDTLRNLMQKKLSKLGQHYYQMFIMPEQNCLSFARGVQNNNNNNNTSTTTIPIATNEANTEISM